MESEQECHIKQQQNKILSKGNKEREEILKKNEPR
jgi:hypothetical protein